MLTSAGVGTDYRAVLVRGAMHDSGRRHVLEFAHRRARERRLSPTRVQFASRRCAVAVRRGGWNPIRWPKGRRHPGRHPELGPDRVEFALPFRVA